MSAYLLILFWALGGLGAVMYLGWYLLNRWRSAPKPAARPTRMLWSRGMAAAR